jgi:hypothetical protein
VARRCMAPERVEGNVSYGRCPNRPLHFAAVMVGTIPLAVWFCTDHLKAAFYPDATPDPEEDRS